MSAGAAAFIAHDAHHPDSEVAEKSNSRRSSLNPFHHNGKHAPATTEGEGEFPTERRRSSVVELAKRVGHAMNKERKGSQQAFESFYGVEHDNNHSGGRRASAFVEHAQNRKSSVAAPAEPTAAEPEVTK